MPSFLCEELHAMLQDSSLQTQIRPLEVLKAMVCPLRERAIVKRPPFAHGTILSKIPGGRLHLESCSACIFLTHSYNGSDQASHMMPWKGKN